MPWRIACSTPYLPDALENADDEPRLSAIVALSEFDVDRALELFENGKFRNEGFRYQGIRDHWRSSLR